MTATLPTVKPLDCWREASFCVTFRFFQATTSILQAFAVSLTRETGRHWCLPAGRGHVVLVVKPIQNKIGVRDAHGHGQTQVKVETEMEWSTTTIEGVEDEERTADEDLR